ncbi:MAG: hypothetical protein M1837_001419 [Sclerophora amabilis]|nr:MAG: hypothetical protein M1837_001419 [Sclerophora amabilis]
MTDCNAPEAIVPYQIHVSSKYLELTKRKLQLTRLPHDLSFPSGDEWDWGTPKSKVAPLLDFWLESYVWRDQESWLNTILPQQRTKIQPAAPHPSLWTHFVHKRSKRPRAIPLLYCHSWPGGVLETSRIIDALTDPGDDEQAFHVVAPSIPGFGFSEADPNNQIGMRTVADIFNQLMLRLGYPCYVAHGSDL